MSEKTITAERTTELAKALRDLSSDEAMSGITMLDSGETVMVGTLLGEAAIVLAVAALTTPSQQEQPRDLPPLTEAQERALDSKPLPERAAVPEHVGED